MNRGEYEKVLDKVVMRLTEQGGNFAKLFPNEDPENLRKMAAIALLTVDEYYSHLTQIMRDTDPED